MRKRVLSEGHKQIRSGSSVRDGSEVTEKSRSVSLVSFRVNPISGEQGRLTRWYAAADDSERAQQQAEERHQENEKVAFVRTRQGSMFEEIVEFRRPPNGAFPDIQGGSYLPPALDPRGDWHGQEPFWPAPITSFPPSTGICECELSCHPRA